VTEIIVRSGEGLTEIVEARGHTIVVDEPTEGGGDDAGPTPYELLLGALGTCTAITVRMYATRKDWPLESVEVHLAHERVHAEDCENCDNPHAAAFLDRISKRVIMHGSLSTEQQARLLDISERCPVQRTLQSSIAIQTARS
jgi:putative redox protein